MKEHSLDLINALNTTDIPKAINEWVAKLGEDVNGQKYYTQNDIDVLAKAFGMSPEEMEKRLGAYRAVLRKAEGDDSFDVLWNLDYTKQLNSLDYNQIYKAAQ